MAKVRTKREMRSRRKRFMAMAGTMDFLGVVGSCAVILVCTMLITALVSWVRSDIPVTLAPGGIRHQHRHYFARRIALGVRREKI